MFTDPLSVTYNGSSKSLPRISVEKDYTRYQTADGEFEVLISNNLRSARNGVASASVKLARRIPDPTPGDVFNKDFREIRNVFGLSYSFDALTRAETSVDVPRLRTALLALVDSTFQGRVISGEK